MFSVLEDISVTDYLLRYHHRLSPIFTTLPFSRTSLFSKSLNISLLQRMANIHAFYQFAIIDQTALSGDDVMKALIIIKHVSRSNETGHGSSVGSEAVWYVSDTEIEPQGFWCFVMPNSS